MIIEGERSLLERIKENIDEKYQETFKIIPGNRYKPLSAICSLKRKDGVLKAASSASVTMVERNKYEEGRIMAKLANASDLIVLGKDNVAPVNRDNAGPVGRDKSGPGDNKEKKEKPKSIGKKIGSSTSTRSLANKKKLTTNIRDEYKNCPSLFTARTNQINKMRMEDRALDSGNVAPLIGVHRTVLPIKDTNLAQMESVKQLMRPTPEIVVRDSALVTILRDPAPTAPVRGKTLKITNSGKMISLTDKDKHRFTPLGKNNRSINKSSSSIGVDNKDDKKESKSTNLTKETEQVAEKSVDVKTHVHETKVQVPASSPGPDLAKQIEQSLEKAFDNKDEVDIMSVSEEDKEDDKEDDKEEDKKEDKKSKAKYPVPKVKIGDTCCISGGCGGDSYRYYGTISNILDNGKVVEFTRRNMSVGGGLFKWTRSCGGVWMQMEKDYKTGTMQLPRDRRYLWQLRFCPLDEDYVNLDPHF